MPTQDLFAVIMAGGSGTRFWPASRIARPKQFLPISGEQSMIAETFARIEPMIPAERILVVTAGSQAELVREALPQLPHENVLCEPVARNTAPCVAWAAVEVARRSPNSIQVVLPADHVINPAESFRATVQAAAAEAAESDVLITLGIQPDSPHTGYGYIETAAKLNERAGIEVLEVKRFVEKPNLERAQEFLAQGGFYWNAGIFVWSTASILKAVEQHVPDLHAGLAKITAGESVEEVYPTLPAEPIDVAVMERADNVRMLPINYTWNDVGSWAALPDVHKLDEDGNCVVTDETSRVISIDSKNCVSYAEKGRLIAMVGVEDLIVVQTEDATLVLPKSRAQEVKAIVDRLKNEAPNYL
ncbi:MAG: mannose-1-phosphate guanylyltransferase [Planctomycetota bacterium]|jgi:mannose-1-phosphate guanylyltransferase